MKNQFTQNFLILATLCGFLPACSMQTPKQAYNISVTMPNASSTSVAKFATHQLEDSISDLATKNQISCLALNILGSGITMDPRTGYNNSKNDMGQLVGLIDPSGGASLSADVLAGASRTIQLLGVKGIPTATIPDCETFESIVSSPTYVAGTTFNNINFYLLGQTTTDVFADVSVSINANFESTTQVFQNGGNGTPAMATIGFDYFSIPGATISAILTNNNCVPIGIYANNFGSTPLPDQLTVTWNLQSVSGTVLDPVSFYTQSSCTTSAKLANNPDAGSTGSLTLGGLNSTSTVPSWGNAGYIQLYLEMGSPAQSNATTFQISGSSANPLWSTQPLTLTGVSSSISPTVDGNSPAVPNFTLAESKCHVISLLPTGLENKSINISVVNSSVGSNLSNGLSVYPGSLCGSSGNVPALTYTQNNGGNRNYSALTLGSVASFSIEDSSGDNLFMSISDVNNQYQPTKIGLAFEAAPSPPTSISLTNQSSPQNEMSYTIQGDFASGSTVSVYDNSSCSGGGTTSGSIMWITATNTGPSTSIANSITSTLYSKFLVEYPNSNTNFSLYAQTTIGYGTSAAISSDCTEITTHY